MNISFPDTILFGIIFLLGALTTFTDLKYRKIYNRDLIICLLLGMVVLAFTLSNGPEIITFHLINGLIALVAGYFLFRFKVWRGGDAKLYITYAICMPATNHGNLFLSEPFRLFACSFIAGTIILIPMLLISLYSNYKTIISTSLSEKVIKRLFTSTTNTVLASWALFPFYRMISTAYSSSISLTMACIALYLIRHTLKNLKNKKPYQIELLFLVMGFITHAVFPHSFGSWSSVVYSTIKVIVFSFLFALAYTSLEVIKEEDNRFPFAPVIFMGCLLTYTPFLVYINALNTHHPNGL